MIFLDIETQNSFEEEEAFTTSVLKISYAGIIDYDTKEEIDIWEDDMEKLHEILEKADLIAGYNSISFDLPVIGNYLGRQVNDYPQLDLMVAAKEKIGFRPKLNALSNATLGRGKLGKGMDAVRYYANGELDKLKEYCMEDVRLTMELYDYGLKNKKIKYFDRNGFDKETEIDWSLGYKNYPPTKVSGNTNSGQPPMPDQPSSSSQSASSNQSDETVLQMF